MIWRCTPKCKPRQIARRPKTCVDGRGLGKTRHVEVCYLWLQDAVARKEGEILKIPGETTPADLMTKFMTGGRTEDLKKLMGCLLYTSPSPRDRTRSRMPSSA